MSQISKDEAQQLVNNFREANPDAIRSLWLNEAIINFIKEADDLDGLRVYQAQTGGGIYTVVVSPTKGEDEVHLDTHYFDYASTCPPECGGNNL